jgi:signal transduction histidine kinase/CheY-like chemotaxis protein
MQSSPVLSTTGSWQHADDSDRATALRIDTVVKSSPKNLLTGVFGSFVMAYACMLGSDAGRPATPWIWFALLAAGLVRGAVIAYRFGRSGNDSNEAIIAFGQRLQRNGLYCAVMWGSASWLMLPNANGSFLMVATAMVFMGGAVSQAIHRPLLLGFILAATATFTTGLLYQGGQFNYLLAIAFWLLAFVILSAARTQENAVNQAIRYRFQTEELLQERIYQQKLTDSARAEAEEARAKAEVANQGKTTFLAAASHDLRQPMHALVQYFGVLERRNHDPALIDTVSRMGKSLDAMQELLDSILEVSKLMMGVVRPNISTFPIQKIIDSLDAQLRPVAEAKGLTFVAEDDGSSVTTDLVLLERILRNLTLNAIRYTDEGRVLVRCRRRNAQLRIEVWDTGIGIPRNELSNIFEAFYQVANDARDRRKGLGLGLALVKQLVDLLSLRVRVRSTERKGSLFLVEMPLALAVHTPRRTVEALSRMDHVRGAFVVVIDDDEDSLQATATTVVEFGCRALTATSGLDAIAKLQGQEFMPQLILSDYRLGAGETGIDAIRLVTQNQKALFGDGFALPSLLVSGDTAPSELQKVVEAGLSMLHKPVRPQDLHDQMNAMLEKLGRGA